MLIQGIGHTVILDALENGHPVLGAPVGNVHAVHCQLQRGVLVEALSDGGLEHITIVPVLSRSLSGLGR